MNATQNQLWREIEGLNLDDPAAQLTFTQRLARENGWTPNEARRVVNEYKKFLFLATCAGHPVTPSDAVDQAWHLHLVYTESYWTDLCREILGRPLHHGPTKGGETESAKFHDWYSNTLASYQKFFQQAPPSDIWPSAAVRFDDAPCFRRVNAHRHWIVPKPRLVGWLKALPAARAIGAMLLALVLAGCSTVTVQGLNVFDWRGSDFLKFFGCWSVAVFLIAGLLRWKLRESVLYRRDLPDDPYLIALLTGGERQAEDAALTKLAAAGVVEIGDGTNPTVRRLMPDRPDMHLFESAVAEVIGSAMSTDIKTTRLMMGTHIAAMQKELVARGWVLSPERMRLARWMPLSVSLLVAGVGILKLIIGLMRDRPVGYLAEGIVVTALLAVFFFGRRPWRTTAGDEVVKALRKRHGAMKSNRAWAARSEALAGLPLAVGLFGLSALAATPYEAFRRRLQPPAGASGCGGGCGSTSCSGGDGGDGCGGGCGGCGGCGGD
jgi:uncharacterized protein (TIGR04222 family)